MDGFEFDYDGGVETGTDVAEDLVHEVDFPDFVQSLLGDTHSDYDLIGADPDEDGLWSHLMVNDDVNPYVAN